MRAIAAAILQLIVKIVSATGRQVEHILGRFEVLSRAVMLAGIAFCPYHIGRPEQTNGAVQITLEN
jgi:hypothetical protein